MSLGFCPLASSSQGNCYLITTENTTLLLDLGISLKRIEEALSNFHISISDVDAVLITHEHSDHILSIKSILKRVPDLKLILTEGTASGIFRNECTPDDRISYVKANDSIEIGDIVISSFPTSHDTNEPCAFYFEHKNKKVTVVTDTGCVTDEVMDAIVGSDVLAIESNHEVNYLLYGRYPYPLKRRILSDVGHLSNESCGNALVKYLDAWEKETVPKVFLAHLSKENNTPDQAFLTVSTCLEENDYYVGKDLELEVVPQYEMGRFVIL